jgi:hypothetical protein
MMSHAAMASGTLVITTGIISAARPAASRAAGEAERASLVHCAR